jgi:hypothetical protein
VQDEELVVLAALVALVALELGVVPAALELVVVLVVPAQDVELAQPALAVPELDAELVQVLLQVVPLVVLVLPVPVVQ